MKKAHTLPKNLGLFVIGFIIIAGCSAKRAIIIHRTISPKNPTMVVIPAWPDSKNVNFANKVESAILRAGVQVYERPGLKYRETTKSTGMTTEETQRGHAKSSEGSVEEKIIEIDWDAVYKESKADYVAITYISWSIEVPTVRIIKREDRRVIASVPIYYVSNNPSFTISNQIYSALFRLGLTEITAEEACPTLNILR